MNGRIRSFNFFKTNLQCAFFWMSMRCEFTILINTTKNMPAPCLYGLKDVALISLYSNWLWFASPQRDLWPYIQSLATMGCEKLSNYSREISKSERTWIGNALWKQNSIEKRGTRLEFTRRGGGLTKMEEYK